MSSSEQTEPHGELHVAPTALSTLAPAPIMPSVPQGGSAPVVPAEVPAAAPITEHEVGEYREQDRYLPIANVARIMKNSVPATAKISKEAKECVQECVSEFIAFVTAEAADRCGAEKRKTVGGEDILQALGALGFDNYAEALKIYLARLRQQQQQQIPAGQSRSEHNDTSTP